jgi:uncharacterized cupredoxin-like copper-binding protein
MVARRYVVALAALTLAAVSCGGGGGVGATLEDFSITLDSDSASAGEVTFSIQNNGPSVHEFVVIKTDLAPDALPTTEEDGVTIVDEEGQGIEPVDEVEDIPVGESPELTVNLDAGSYVIICNISENGGHYLNGMHTGFTVE